MTSQAIICSFAALLLATLVSQVCAYPHGDIWPPDYSTDTQPKFTDLCRIKEDVETLCQTCAKITRSNIVYPMCCEGREEARPWCEKYIAYGQHS